MGAEAIWEKREGEGGERGGDALAKNEKVAMKKAGRALANSRCRADEWLEGVKPGFE